MAVEYGTLEPVVAEKRSNKKTVALAVFLAVSAVVALSFTVGSGTTNSVVNSNLGRAQVTDVSGEVSGLFKTACENWESERFVVSTFNQDQDSIVAAVKASASDHWERDWQSFKNALSVTKVAFSVYNFPVWDDADDFTVIPTFVTYLEEGADLKWKYLGGSFLGGAAIAAKCTGSSAIIVNQGMSYVDACMKVTGDASRCKAANDEVCPFSGVNNPCDTCTTNSFVRTSIDSDCCDAVNKWCANPANKDGCSTYARAIYDANCDEAFHALQKHQTTLLDAFEEEDDKCNEACANPCVFIQDTYQQCSGCANNLHEYQYADAKFTANCYPSAIGFQGNRCCGVGEATARCASYADDKGCEVNSPVDDQCSWMDHKSCGEAILAEKVRLAEEAEKARLAAEAENEAEEQE